MIWSQFNSFVRCKWYLYFLKGPRYLWFPRFKKDQGVFCVERRLRLSIWVRSPPLVLSLFFHLTHILTKCSLLKVNFLYLDRYISIYLYRLINGSNLLSLIIWSTMLDKSFNFNLAFPLIIWYQLRKIWIIIAIAIYIWEGDGKPLQWSKFNWKLSFGFHLSSIITPSNSLESNFWICLRPFFMNQKVN